MSEHKEKKLTSYNYIPVLTDFILRWIVLGAYRFDYLGNIWLWLLNILVIPIIIIVMLFMYDIIHDSTSSDYDIKHSTISTLTSFLILFFGVYIMFNIYEDIHTFWKFLMSIVTFLVYGLYVLLLYVFSYKKPSSINEVETDEAQSGHEKNEDNTDLNDMDIVRLEGILHYTNDRVNSYILESALFSGLAFAGFITLITSEKLHISEISTLLNTIKNLLNSFIYFDLSSLSAQITLFTQDDLFIIIMIESLFCTLAFVSVIASRLRFSDILEEIEISVKTARSFNDKEEEVSLLHLETNQEQYLRRITYLSKKIEKEVEISNEKLENIKPILSTIRIIRTIGMIFFFSMIITSALLINGLLAFFVLLSSIVVTIVMNVDHSFRIKKVKNLNIHLPKKLSHR